METVRPFFQFLQKFIDFSEEEFNERIKPYLKVRRFHKKDTIHKPGEVENYFNYVLHGLVRKYYKKGEEVVITQIAKEEQLIHAQESFHSRTPSDYCIEALEPTVLVSMTYDDLEKVYSSHAKMERLGRLIITFSMVMNDKWQVIMTRLSPRERFLYFVQKCPELLQRVPQKDLASYLNIQPETFSRFKHMLKDKKYQ